MIYLPQLFFLAVLAGSVWFFARNVGRIRSNIFRGRKINRHDEPGKRWALMARVAMGQSKMGKRPVAAAMHLLIYVGFVLINIEVLEIVIDGLTGQHRIASKILPHGFYVFLIGFFEVLAAGVLLSCVVFLWRRFVSKVSRLTKGEEMRAWPRLDATTILVTEVVLMLAILFMNASDSVLQTRGVASYLHGDEPMTFLVSQSLMPLLTGLSSNALVGIERAAWWFHILGIFAFLNYLPYSKHFHVILSFPNVWYSDLAPKGQFANLDSVTKEVKLMLSGDPFAAPAAGESPSEPEKFGAKDVHDLPWTSLLNAYTCTECGRCTSVCPANITGKKLSPRKIMMDTRDRLEEVGRGIVANKGAVVEDGKALLHDYITTEELNACTTCNACVEACPININPLRIIMELRTYAAMEESKVPAQWGQMFGNVENNGAPWKFSPSDRGNWMEDVTVKEDVVEA
jgi:heterodisulfide reductase subunit C